MKDILERVTAAKLFTMLWNRGEIKLAVKRGVNPEPSSGRSPSDDMLRKRKGLLGTGGGEGGRCPVRRALKYRRRRNTLTICVGKPCHPPRRFRSL